MPFGTNAEAFRDVVFGIAQWMLDEQLADGGFPAEGKYYRATAAAQSGRSLVDWGGTDRRRTNPYVTLDALFVLGEAGRLSLPDVAAPT